MSNMSNSELGPTGAILRDLPSAYIPHSCGLLHLPRFLAKIRKHLADELPKATSETLLKALMVSFAYT